MQDGDVVGDQHFVTGIADASAQVQVFDMKTEALPVEMQKMTGTERAAYVETKTKERAQLQEKINRLNSERSKHVAAQARKQSGTNTLDAVMVSAIHEQAVKKNYRFD